MVALLLVTASVAIGLTMASKVVRKRGVAPVLARVHEQTALAGLVAIAVHGVTLLADPWLHPGVSGVLVPFAMGYRPLFTGLGIVAGYLAALLGLSFYARRRIGAQAVAQAPPRDGAGLGARRGARARRGHRRGLAVAARVHARDRRPDRRRCSRSGCCAGRSATARSLAGSRPGGAGMSDGIVIAGGGLAAQRCAETLRAQGYDGAIRIVCARAASAVRPAAAVEGAADRRSAARPRSRCGRRAWYEERRVDLLLGTRAVRLDPVRRELELVARRVRCASTRC